MRALLPFVIVGVFTGSLYGLAGVGLVLTFRTSGIFNFAHGAIAAAAAYLFYALHVEHGMAWPLAALLVIVGFGAAAGVAIEQVARRLVGAPEAVLVVATVGLLLSVNGALLLAFGTSTRRFPQVLPATGVVFAGVRVSYAQMISVATAAVCVAGLYLFLRRARLGVAMRAVVDNPALLGLTGTPPTRVRISAWVIGSVFASLSGVLIAPTLGLDAFLLTLLVVQAFGAAAIGGFTSLPATYGGGVLVGVLASVATKYLATRPPFDGLPAAMPFLALVVVLLVIPVRKLPMNRDAFRGVVSRRREMDSRIGAALLTLLGAGLLVLPHVVGNKLPAWTSALTMLIVMASLALLVWTSGQISLAHTAFAAFGATTLSHLTVGRGLPWGLALVLAGLSAVPLGALVAVPAMRLTGVYLALATFGFAILMQGVVYGSSLMFGESPRRGASRPVLAFVDGRDDTWFYYVVLAVAVASCLVLAAIARGRLGRLLRAMSETATMLSTHGLRVNLTRLIVFCVSAFFAGIAGALTVTQTTAVSPVTFQPIQSLLWLAVLASCGTRLLGSSAVAALLFAVVPAYATGITFEHQILAFGLLAVVASMTVANTDRIRACVRRSAAESEFRRRTSPVRDRQGHGTYAGALAE